MRIRDPPRQVLRTRLKTHSKNIIRAPIQAMLASLTCCDANGNSLKVIQYSLGLTHISMGTFKIGKP